MKDVRTDYFISQGRSESFLSLASPICSIQKRESIKSTPSKGNTVDIREASTLEPSPIFLVLYSIPTSSVNTTRCLSSGNL